jgi:hypothetical protein
MMVVWSLKMEDPKGDAAKGSSLERNGIAVRTIIWNGCWAGYRGGN